MTTAIVILITALVVFAAVWGSQHIKQPANVDDRPPEVPQAQSRGLSGGIERPAGPGAEDPPTATPNRVDTQPPKAPS